MVASAGGGAPTRGGVGALLQEEVRMPKKLIEVDLSESPYKNEQIHNRWHPDIPMVSWVKPGDDFVIETYDWTGGFIKDNDSADDVRDIDLSIVHFLSGPIGCLPDQKLLDIWNKREVDFIATDPKRVPPLANAPFPATAHTGTAKGDVKAKVAAEGARTVPPREHGGNCDIKDLSRGSKIYFPVYVNGGGLSK